MKRFTLFALLLVLMGCNDYREPQETSFHGNFQLELLFEKDSCKVYRFFDNGHAVYWSDCTGKMSEEHWHQTGKNTGHQDRMNSLTN